MNSAPKVAIFRCGHRKTFLKWTGAELRRRLAASYARMDCAACHAKTERPQQIEPKGVGL